ncbi:hypothetical protein CVT26_007273, partial [Gymnopilus dilepis]
MESTERLVHISNDHSSLINVVKALGEYLTSEDSTLLQKGVELLALVVEKLPPEKMNGQSVRVLTAFFCGKLDDTVTIKPALTGLLTLAKVPTLSTPEVTTIVESLFRDVRMKSIVQDVRFKVFSIIDSLMAYHRDVLKSMGKTFLDGYVGLAEGEKDPRNLIVAFAIARVILIEFDIHEHSMFNILFCYFPITFRPPPNDRYGITTDDLRIALRNCLNATPAFGPLAIPVFLEKISAGSRATKKDALQTLGACLPVYGAALARVSARKLWNALKLEIFQPVDPEAEEEALKTTQILVRTIYADEEAAVEVNEDIQGLARNVCEECLQILKEPEKSQARPATKVLGAFMLTTPSVARYTISQAVPHLVQLFHNPDEASTRTSTLLLLSELITAARGSATKTPSPEIDPPLLPYKDEVLGVLTIGLKLPSSRLAAISGLNAMVSTPHLLTDEELGFIVHHVREVLEGDEDGFFDESDSILDLLSGISNIAPRHVSEQILPSLFSSLTDSAPTREDTIGRQRSWRVLSTLSKLCLQSELFENLVIRLTTKLDIICFPSAEQLPIISADPEPSAAYIHMILKTLAQALEFKSKEKHPDIAKYIDRLVPHIFNVFVASAFLSDKQIAVATEPRLIEVAGKIVNLVVQATPLQRQQPYALSLSKALLDGDFTDIAQGFQKIDKTRRLFIFTESSTSAQRNLLALLAAAIIALRPEVGLSIEDIGQFLDTLLQWALVLADSDLQKLSAFHIVSSILNRRANAELSSFLNDKLHKYWDNEIASEDIPLFRRKWAITSWIWITKALLVRKHPQAVSFAERLYEAFGDEAVGWDAAKAIGVIPSPDAILTKSNHAEVKVLHVQKYVGTVLPRMIAFAKDSSDPTRQTASIVALTSLIKSIPRAAYAHEMPILIPLLLRGLDLPDPEIRANIIDTFLAAAEGESPDHSLVSEHSVTLVNSMLKNST